MNHIVLAFNVVFPIFFMLMVGYILRLLKVTDEHSLNVMNKLVFRVFLPFLLFLNIYSLNTEEMLNYSNLKLVLLTIVLILIIAISAQAVFCCTVKDKRKRSVMIQGIFRSNLVLFGIPIAASIYGEERIGIVSLLAAVITPIYNILAVILLEIYRSGKVNIKKLILSILKNPLIIASLLAFLLILLQIRIPELVLKPMNSMAKVATPLAFVVLGGTFHFRHISRNLTYLTAVSVGKLIIVPAIILTAGIYAGFRGEALVALIGVAASPTAVSSFTMAVELEADGELAGEIVVFTSILSILTIFLWVLILKTSQVI